MRFGSLLVTIAGCIIACWVVWPLISAHCPRFARKWVVMGLALALLLPYFLYQTLNPDPFDITAHGDSVDYEFRDAGMAYEFAELNEDADWVKIS